MCLVSVTFLRDFITSTHIFRAGWSMRALRILNNYNLKNFKIDEGEIFGYLILSEYEVFFATTDDVEED
jgi:hypothetical protein